MTLRSIFTPRPRAVLCAVFFALFEGIFWKYGVYFFAGEWVRIIGVGIAVYFFSLFITHAGHEVRDAPRPAVLQTEMRDAPAPAQLPANDEVPDAQA